jgi:hypothetical protein
MLTKNFCAKIKNLHISGYANFMKHANFKCLCITTKNLTYEMIYTSFCRVDHGLSNDTKTISVAIMVFEKIGF